MSWNKLVPILAVAFLIFCPLSVMAADGDSNAADATEKSILLDFSGTDDANLNKVIDFDDPVAWILGAFGVQPNPLKITDNHNEVIILKNASFTQGSKSVRGETSVRLDGVNMISADFIIKYVVIKDGFRFNVEDPNYISGDGYEQYVEVLSQTFKQGDTIEFRGAVKYETHYTSVMEYYKNSSSKYLLMNSFIEIRSYTDLVGQVIVNDDDVFDYANKQRVESSMTNENVYLDPAKVEEGDPYVVKIESLTACPCMEMSLSINGKEGELNVDVVKFEKNGTNKHSDSSTATLDTDKDLDMMCIISLSSLSSLRSELWQKDPAEVAKYVGDCGGVLSDSVSDFNAKANRVDNDVTGKSDNDDRTIILIVIGVIVVLAILLIVLWLYHRRGRI